jgi:hypothetical protein
MNVYVDINVITPRDNNNYIEYTNYLVKNDAMYCVIFGGNRPIIRVCTMYMSEPEYVDCFTINGVWYFCVHGVSVRNGRSTMMDISHSRFRALGFNLHEL